MKHLTTAVLILTAMVISASANASPAYTDNHLSRSTELMLMERSYDIGVRDGKKLRKDQVITLQSSNERLEGAVMNIGEQVRDLSHHTGSILRASEGVLEEAQSVNSQSHGLVSTSNRVLEDAVAINDRENFLKGTVATADDVLRIAEEEAAALRKSAASDAHDMITSARRKVHEEHSSPELVMNEAVSCDLVEVDVRQVIDCLVPEGWEARTDIDNRMFLNSRIGFTSDSPRNKAIREFIAAVRDQTQSEVILAVNFYPGIVDKDGNPSPLMVVSEERH
jgi:hypothetical protein